MLDKLKQIITLSDNLAKTDQKKYESFKYDTNEEWAYQNIADSASKVSKSLKTDLKHAQHKNYQQLKYEDIKNLGLDTEDIHASLATATSGMKKSYAQKYFKDEQKTSHQINQLKPQVSQELTTFVKQSELNRGNHELKQALDNQPVTLNKLVKTINDQPHYKATVTYNNQLQAHDKLAKQEQVSIPIRTHNLFTGKSSLDKKALSNVPKQVYVKINDQKTITALNLNKPNQSLQVPAKANVNQKLAKQSTSFKADQITGYSPKINQLLNKFNQEPIKQRNYKDYFNTVEKRAQKQLVHYEKGYKNEHMTLIANPKSHERLHVYDKTPQDISDNITQQATVLAGLKYNRAKSYQRDIDHSRNKFMHNHNLKHTHAIKPSQHTQRVAQKQTHQNKRSINRDKQIKRGQGLTR